MAKLSAKDLEYRDEVNSVSLINFHFFFVPKRRQPVLLQTAEIDLPLNCQHLTDASCKKAASIFSDSLLTLALSGILHRPGMRAATIEEMKQAIAEGASDWT